MATAEKRLGRIGAYLLLAVFLLVSLFPFYWMFLTSMRPDKSIYTATPNLLPTGLSLVQYKALLGTTSFGRYIFNSVVVSVVVTLSSLVFSILAAFSIVRLKPRGSGLMVKSVLFTYLVPPTLLFIPLFVIVRGLGLSNSIWALVLTYHTFTIPFSLWMLIGYFKSIPPDLEQAAMIDGCTRVQSLRKILLPVAAPGIAASAIFSFTLSWNEFLYALIFTTSETAKTIPVGISGLMLGDVYFWGQIMAAALIASVPAVAIYLLAESLMVQGLTSGGLKG